MHRAHLGVRSLARRNLKCGEEQARKDLLMRIGPMAISQEKVGRSPNHQIDSIANFTEQLAHELGSAVRSKPADGTILAQREERIRVVP